MSNPMMGQLNSGKMQSLLGNLTRIKKSIDALSAVGNPQKMMEQLMQSSPQMKQAIEYVNQNGGNPKEVCYKLFKENGLDPQTLEDELAKLK